MRSWCPSSQGAGPGPCCWSDLTWAAASHYDADHLEDIADLTTPVRVLYDRGGGSLAKATATYDRYYAYAEARTHTAVDIGSVLTLCPGADQVTFTVLPAGTDGTAAGGVPVTEENDRGLCVKVEYGSFDMATCGDIDGSDEGSRSNVETAVAPSIGDVEVLKVNHLGSPFSSNTTFVQTVKPNVSIISVGQNSFGHPDPGAVSRLDSAGDVLTTNNPNNGAPVDGNVTMTTAGSSNFLFTTSASGVSLTYGLDEAGGSMPTEPGPQPAPNPAPQPAPGPTPDEPGTKRLAGADRYATAAAIVKGSFPAGTVPVLFVATGEQFADALAGGPAADVLGGPVLPVAKAGISAPIRSELSRLQPARIVILGGSGAVSDAIAAELEGFTTGTVTRLAGANRYDTAARVATNVFTAPVPQVLIATGLGFADALAGGAVGAKTNSPVLLVSTNSLPPETAAALRTLRPNNIAVLGGTGVISEAIRQQLEGFTTGGMTRLSGASRYDTAARIVQVFWPQPVPVVYLATGRNFPDALAGIPAAGSDQAPLLLVEPNCMPAATKRELDRLQPSTLVVLGGTGTVSNAAASGTVCAAPAHAPAPPPPPPSEPRKPANPGDTKNCTDFNTQQEAQAYFDVYYPHYSDVARLDADGDLNACESLP